MHAEFFTMFYSSDNLSSLVAVFPIRLSIPEYWKTLSLILSIMTDRMKTTEAKRYRYKILGIYPMNLWNACEIYVVTYCCEWIMYTARVFGAIHFIIPGIKPLSGIVKLLNHMNVVIAKVYVISELLYNCIVPRK